MNELPLWAAIPTALLLILSGALTLTGSLGLLRFRNFYSRIHAPTLGNTLGVGCLLLASILVSSILHWRPVLHEVLIMLFLFITSPITAMLLMQAAVQRDARKAAPDKS
jgi:multicomponent K+:H+ antiporter subunit G